MLGLRATVLLSLIKQAVVARPYPAYYDSLGQHYRNTQYKPQQAFNAQQIHILIPLAPRPTSYIAETVSALHRNLGAAAVIHIFHATEKTDPVNSKHAREYFYNDNRLAIESFAIANPATHKNTGDWMTPTHVRHNLLVAYMMSFVPTLDDTVIFAVVEDDMVMCDAFAYIFGLALLEAEHVSNYRWSAIRTSAGANGVFFHAYDAPVLSEFIAARRESRINDNLLLEWYNGETQDGAKLNDKRMHFITRHLFTHIGMKSSFGEQRSRIIAQSDPITCYIPVKPELADWLAYDTKHCSATVISPCMLSPIRQ